MKPAWTWWWRGNMNAATRGQTSFSKREEISHRFFAFSRDCNPLLRFWRRLHSRWGSVREKVYKVTILTGPICDHSRGQLRAGYCGLTTVA